MTFQYMKKNPSPLVYKLAKTTFSYDPRFPKICSVNRKKGFAAAWSFTYESRFSRKLRVNEKKSHCCLILHRYKRLYVRP